MPSESSRGADCRLVTSESSRMAPPPAWQMPQQAGQQGTAARDDGASCLEAYPGQLCQMVKAAFTTNAAAGRLPLAAPSQAFYRIPCMARTAKTNSGMFKTALKY